MKKHITITTCAAALLSLSLCSCSDFLDLDPLNEIVEEDFWTSEDDVESIVLGCYSAMQSEEVAYRMMVWGEFRSDNIVGATNVENYEALANIFKENINAKNDFTTWGEFYDIINRCNLVLLHAPDVAETDPNYTESELNATRAEVIAIRSLMYFYLIRTFRDVPYNTEAYTADNQELAIPATSFDVILDSLINDLEEVKDYAIDTYPETQPLYQRGRITLDAINALLCELYLWKEDYSSCIYYADLVIDAKIDEFTSGSSSETTSGMSQSNRLYEGYPLIEDEARNGSSWGEAYNEIFGDGASDESIFELIYTNDESMLSNDAVSYMYGNQTTFPGYVGPAEYLSSDVDDALYEVFNDEYDTRYYENIEAVSSSVYGIGKYSNSAISVEVTSSDISASGSHYVADNCYANWIIYRITDIMLLKAEALVQLVNESDSTTESGKELNDSLLNAAYEIVSVINQRSNCATTYTEIGYSNYSSKSQMEELVLLERQKELMFEGKRWYDLVRKARRDGNTTYLVSKVSLKGSVDGSVVESKLAKLDGMYWPYNDDELKVNPYLEQNSAFSSGEDDTYESTANN